jgi:hypothetical protein
MTGPLAAPPRHSYHHCAEVGQKESDELARCLGALSHEFYVLNG